MKFIAEVVIFGQKIKMPIEAKSEDRAYDYILDEVKDNLSVISLQMLDPVQQFEDFLETHGITQVDFEEGLAIWKAI